MRYPSRAIALAKLHPESWHIIYDTRPGFNDAMHCAKRDNRFHDIRDRSRCDYIGPGGTWPNFAVALVSDIINPPNATHSHWR